MAFFVVSYFRDFVIKDLLFFQFFLDGGLECKLLAAFSSSLSATLVPHVYVYWVYCVRWV